MLGVAVRRAGVTMRRAGVAMRRAGGGDETCWGGGQLCRSCVSCSRVVSGFYSFHCTARSLPVLQLERLECTACVP